MQPIKKTMTPVNKDFNMLNSYMKQILKSVISMMLRRLLFFFFFFNDSFRDLQKTFQNLMNRYKI